MKSEITKEYGYLKLNGKYYEFNEKADHTSYIEVKKEKVEKKIEFVKEIVEKLKEDLDKKAVLIESLIKLPQDYLEQLHNALYNSKRKIKPKTRRHYCVD